MAGLELGHEDLQCLAEQLPEKSAERLGEDANLKFPLPRRKDGTPKIGNEMSNEIGDRHLQGRQAR